jgi:hypothetical protein
MGELTYRPPSDDERERIDAAYNDYYSFGDRFSTDEVPVVVVEGYETGDGSYAGRVAIVVDGGANATTFGFDDGGAFLLSDALNELRGEDPF